MSTIEKPPRSTRTTGGCRSCQRSKVKCPKQKPVCRRCERLNMACSWPEPRASLRERRRGFGPLKSRGPYEPAVIRPVEMDLSAEPSIDSIPELTTTESYSEPTTELYFTTEPEPQQEPCLSRTPDGDENSTLASPPMIEQSIVAFDPSCEMLHETDSVYTIHHAESPANVWANVATPSMTLSSWHIPSASSVLLGPLEQDAIYFFEQRFANAGPKTFIWSPFAVLLRYAVEDSMLMHLTLASCLSRMATQSQLARSTLISTSRMHASRGKHELSTRLAQKDTDPCKVAMAVFLLQRTYSAIWDDQTRSSLAQLSDCMAAYIQRYRLLNLYRTSVGDDDFDDGDVALETAPDTIASSSPRENAILARFLMLTAYEDIDSEHCGVGGAIADLIMTHTPTAAALFRAGHDCQRLFFGEEYPPEEHMDDIQRFRPLEFHFKVNVDLHRAYKFCQRQDFFNSLRRLERYLVNLGQQYSDVVSLADCTLKNKLTTICLYVTAHYHAVLVVVRGWLLWENPDDDVVARLRDSRQNLQRCGRKMVKEHPEAFSWRNQWPLYIMMTRSGNASHTLLPSDQFEMRYVVSLEQAALRLN